LSNKRFLSKRLLTAKVDVLLERKEDAMPKEIVKQLFLSAKKADSCKQMHQSKQQS
jgi:hypothetical protein